MLKIVSAVLVVITSMFIGFTQPELVENGQPSDSAKPGTIITSGEGVITINGYVSQLSVKFKGDIIISARSKDKIKTTNKDAKPEKLSNDDIDKYFPLVAANAAAKAIAKKSGYIIYREYDGEIKLDDNRFIVKIYGKVENMIVFGIGVIYFDGTGKYKVTKQGATDIVEGEWQKIDNEEENQKKKKKTILTPVIYGDYNLTAKVKPKPRAK